MRKLDLMLALVCLSPLGVQALDTAAEKAMREGSLGQALTPACRDRFIAHTRSLDAGSGLLMDPKNPSDAACLKQLYAAMGAERKIETLPAVPPDLKAECKPAFQYFLVGIDWVRVAASDTQVTPGVATKAQAFRATPCGQVYFELMKGKEAAQWADYKNASTQLKMNMIIYWMMDKRHP